MTVNEQIRRSICFRFEVGERFTIGELRHRAPELSHIRWFDIRLANLARDGFLVVESPRRGSRVATGQERDRGVGSIDPGSGNGHGPEPTPDVATLGRVLELWCERFGQDRVEGEHDEGSLADDLDARIAEEPRLGEWMHLCDQVARQPFLAIGIGRDLGPVTLAWLVRDRDRIHRAKHMRYANERRAARA